MSISKTRQKLVDVARQLFAKNGLENTTMNDIAQASGKGRRTLYTYFKSKEDIYYAVIESELERLAASANGKRLEGMVDGAALEAAVKSGDAASLEKMLGALLSTPEGKALAADVQKIMGK